MCDVSAEDLRANAIPNVRISRQGGLAGVWADFVLTENGEKSRGRLKPAP